MDNLQLTRGGKVMLFVIGTCQELKEMGLLGGGPNLSKQGLEQFIALRESGFRPTADEIVSVMRYLQSEEAEQVLKQYAREDQEAEMLAAVEKWMADNEQA